MSKTSNEGTKGEKDLLSEYIKNNPDLKINTMNFKPGVKEIEAIKAKISDIKVLADEENIIEIALKDNMKTYDSIPVEKTSKKHKEEESR